MHHTDRRVAHGAALAVLIIIFSVLAMGCDQAPASAEAPQGPRISMVSLATLSCALCETSLWAQVRLAGDTARLADLELTILDATSSPDVARLPEDARDYEYQPPRSLTLYDLYAIRPVQPEQQTITFVLREPDGPILDTLLDTIPQPDE